MNSIDEFIEKIEKNFNIKIKDKRIIEISLTHTSKETYEPPINFERLEFLGDSILNFIISERVFKKYKKLNEGDLAKLKSVYISKDTLSLFSRILKINEYLILGKGEERSKGREKDNILCDAFESFIGAIYLDSGIRSVKKIINKLIKKIHIDIFYDSKTYLQEITQKRYNLLPKYTIIETKGAEHEKIYVVGVLLNGKIIGIGEGKSKKEAEKIAAKEAIRFLEENEKNI